MPILPGEKEEKQQYREFFHPAMLTDNPEHIASDNGEVKYNLHSF